ncbi:hypothetical protein D3C85_1924570 [compost metagenome]
MITVTRRRTDEFPPCTRRVGVPNHLPEEFYYDTRAEHDDAVEAGSTVPTKAGET